MSSKSEAITGAKSGPLASLSTAPANRAILQRKCACGQHTIAGGACEECGKTRLQRSAASQFDHTAGLPQFRISAPGDHQEQEADRMAERVMSNAAAKAPGDASNAGRYNDSAAPEKSAQTVQRRETASTGGNRVSGDVSAYISSLAGVGVPLDGRTRDFMEPRFGQDFSQVRIHTDARAADSARAINALAYTVGNDVVFGAGQYSPHASQSRKLLAHELAHVVQQRGGGGTPSEGSMPVIQRFTAFTAADQAAGKSLGWIHPGSANLRVADSGLLAVEDNGWGAGKSKRAWALPANIAQANKILSAQSSRVKLVSKGGGISGQVPVSPKLSFKLDEIEPVNAATGAPLELARDCGSACKQITGSTPTEKDVAVLKSGKSEKYTTAKDYHGDDPTTPEEWSEEVFKMEFGAGLTRSEAYAKYDALSDKDKKKFDEKYGINKFAVPKIGQGLTVSTEKDMPGFARFPGMGTWNFHYAATVLQSGPDYVTLENAAGWKPDDWIFFMYGPAAKAQTFHEFHGATQTHGTKWTTMVVQPEKLLHTKTTKKDAPLLIGTSITKLPLGTAVKIIEKSTDGNGIEWSKVEVEAGTHIGKVGMLMKTYLD